MSGNLTEAFRKLYFHLYTNSDASRPERILEDLALVVLLVLAPRTDGAPAVIERFRAGEGSANELLLPSLRRAYPDLVLPEQRFRLGDAALRRTLDDLHGARLHDAPGHALGEAFQALIGPRIRGDKGQFFTPRSLVRAMVRVVAPAAHESVVDPACGTGGFLVEAHAFAAARAEAKPTGALVGRDKDADLARLAAALLRVAAGGRADVHAANSLDVARWGEARFDVVLTNPPFGAKIAVADPAILRGFELAKESHDPQVLFLELCVRLLRDGGRMGIVLPEGMFGNRAQAGVWEWLRARGRIFALLDCPRTTFQPGTDTKTNVLFFEKGAKGSPGARVAVALQCGHDRRGRATLANGRPHPDDFPAIGDDFHARGPTWRDVVLSRPEYLVPRYYVERAPLTPAERALTRGAPEATLGELRASGHLALRKGHEVGSEAYGTGDVPFVRTSDIANYEVTSDPTKSVSEEIYARYAPQQRLRAGDVLLVVDGRYRIGQTALLTEATHRCVVQSHFRILSLPKPRELDPYALLFALTLPSVRLRLRDLVFVQSTLGTLGSRLLELRVPILHGRGPWQKRVAAFRRALEARGRLLAEMRAMTAPEVEL